MVGNCGNGTRQCILDGGHDSPLKTKSSVKAMASNTNFSISGLGVKPMTQEFGDEYITTVKV